MKKFNIAILSVTILLQCVNLWAAKKIEQRALLAYLKVQPGKAAQFLQAAQPVIEATRREPGNLIYILHQSTTTPEQFVFYELFRNETDLKFHRNAKHVRDFLQAVNPILVPGQFILEEYAPTDLGRVPQAKSVRPVAQGVDGLIRACPSSSSDRDCAGKLEGDDCGGSNPAEWASCRVYAEGKCSCVGSW